jgi:hypothetical protein
VVKHYRGKKKRRKVVVTRYPDMSGIVDSEKQRERRNLFREAVVYAKWVICDEERKKAFRKTLPRKRRRHVYQAAIRLYMSMQGDAGWLRKQLAVKAMMQSGQVEWGEKTRTSELKVKKTIGEEKAKMQGGELEETWSVMWQKNKDISVDKAGRAKKIQHLIFDHTPLIDFTVCHFIFKPPECFS